MIEFAQGQGIDDRRAALQRRAFPGTPVVTSRTSSLPEIAGDAALYVNPYETDDIARAIKTITADAGLREELALRGRAQADLFSVARYRERVAALYERLR